jgi:hypothetical protein
MSVPARNPETCVPRPKPKTLLPGIHPPTFKDPDVLPPTQPTVLQDIAKCIKRLQDFESRLRAWQQRNPKRSLDKELVSMASVKKQLDHCDVDIAYMDERDE